MIKVFSSENVLLVALFVVFLIVGNFPFPSSGGFGFDLFMNLFTLVILVPAVLIRVFFLISQEKIIVNRFLTGVLAFVLTLTLPLLWAHDLLDSIFRILGLWFGLMLLFSLSTISFVKIEVLIRAILVSIFLQTLISIFDSFIFKLDLEIGVFSRPEGTFYQVNVLASYVATGVVLSFYYFKSEIKWLRFIAIGQSFFGPLVLMLILSRSALIGLAVALSLMAIHSLLKRNQLGWWLVLLCGFMSGAVLLFWQAQVDGLPRSIDSLGGHGGRLNDWRFMIELMKVKWLFGYGYGSFDSVMLFEWARAMEEGSVTYEVIRNNRHPHNELMLWWFEAGMIFVIASFSFIWWLFSCLYQKGFKKFLYPLALLAPLLVHSLLELPFYHSFIHWVLFVILVHFGIQKEFDWLIHTSVLVSKFRVLVLLAVPLTIVLFSTGIHTQYQIYKLKSTGAEAGQFLTNVVNPFLHFYDLRWIIIFENIKGSAKLNFRESVDQYIDDGLLLFEKRPYREYFMEFIYSAQYVGLNERAIELWEQGERYYFDYEPFISFDSPEAWLSHVSETGVR